MMERGIKRMLLGAFIGALGGVSLATSIFPFAIARLFQEISYEALTGAMSFSSLVALVWAIGGGFVGWRGGAREGGVVFALCGVIGGLILGVLAAKGSLLLVAASMLVGLVYGFFGGLLMGWVFPTPINET